MDGESPISQTALFVNHVNRTTKNESSIAKSENETLKEEIAALRNQLNNATNFYNRRLQEIVTDYDSKFNHLWAQIQPFLPAGTNPPMPTHFAQANTNPNTVMPFQHPNMPGGVYQAQTHHMQHQPMMHQPAAAPMAQQPAATPMMPPQQVANTAPPPSNDGYTMQSLSHVAGVKLQSPSVQPQLPTAQPAQMTLANNQGEKRAAEAADDSNTKKSKADATGEAKADDSARI